MAVFALAAMAPVVARASDDPAPRELSGVLKRIRDRGEVRIGCRADAAPFAFAAPDGGAQGYSVDICRAIAAEISRVAGGPPLRIEYVRVTAGDRVRQVAEGRIDLECGTTTGTAERRRQVAFSPLVYVAATRLLVKRDGAIRSERDLPGRTVAVVRGTTNEAAVRAFAARPGGAFRIEVSDDFAQGFGRLASGAVDALAADDALAAGFLATRDARGHYALVGAPLSHEPYGIMFARDDAHLEHAVAAAFRRLAATREIRRIHDRWFVEPLPAGARLGMPMSRELQRAWELQGLPPG